MNKFRADLHIHSRFSRATSRKLTLPLLAGWAGIKGISVLGTGDFTHPAWRAEMVEQLVLDEQSGLYTLRDASTIQQAVPEVTLGGVPEEFGVRFIIQGEISSIYKRDGKVRKVHNLVFMPDIESADKFSHKLSQVGNIKSDGRPIIGLDSRDLLEMVLETDPRAFLIPAHIWTPWFSLFGSKSGFDSIEDCFGDLTDHVFALETGLSSDPAMNRLWSQLDNFRLVSNSDAHSGENLGREVNLFSGEISYSGILQSLKYPEKPCNTTFEGTLEFFPEEGKYHEDGHRKCDVHLTPQETRELRGICPVCKLPLTVGVLYRVIELADRNEPMYPDNTSAETLVPLPEVLGEILGVGSKTKKVAILYNDVLKKFGSELTILQNTPVDELAKFFPPLGEAISRMRSGDVFVESGYDGEYGTVRMFSDKERSELLRGTSFGKNRGSQSLLLLNDFPDFKNEESKLRQKKDIKIQKLDNSFSKTSQNENFFQSSEKIVSNEEFSSVLNTKQEEATFAGPGPVLVIAGPGTGKTKTLVSRVLRLLQNGIEAKRILAVTFTRKAAFEMAQRLRRELKNTTKILPNTDTLHALALEFWIKQKSSVPVLLSEEDGRKVFIDANLGENPSTLKEAWQKISLLREQLLPFPEQYDPFVANYTAQKLSWNLADYTDLLEFWLQQMLSGKHELEWEQLLIDEIQDLSPLQLTLIKMLLPQNGDGFFGIGDPNQSIYGFRGASGQCISFFSKAWKDLQIISLTYNYRSRPEIIQVAERILGDQDACSTLQPVRNEKAIVHIFKSPTAESEVRWVSDKISDILGGGSHTLQDIATKKMAKSFKEGEYAPGDIAILVRTHALGQAFRKNLAGRNIPVAEPQTDVFWSDIRVRLILVIAGRMLGININATESEEKIPECPETILKKGPMGIAAYMETTPPFDVIFWKSVAFKDLIKAYQENKGWAGLISWVSLQTELEIVRSKSQQVQILSLHASKGLEFPIVFMPCLEDGLLPFYGANMLVGKMDKNGIFDIDEERRLAYVGMTRAQDALFLSYSEKRMLFGKELRLNASRFFDTLPMSLVGQSSLVMHKKEEVKQLNLF